MKILLFVLSISGTPKDSVFINKVLTDFRRHSYFLSLNIKSTEYNGRIVIENDELYYYFRMNQQINKQEYKELIINVLKGDSSLKIKDANLKKWHFKKSPVIESVEENAKKGINEFINVYFNDRLVLRNGLTDEVRFAVISQLFEWRIPACVDDQSGYLYITR